MTQTAQTFNADTTTDEVLRGRDLRGLRILVTGVSAGLGVETARSLVAHGAEVIGTARDLDKARRATAHLVSNAHPEGSLIIEPLDLASLASIRDGADRLLADGRSFDVVIANAGVMATPFAQTADGFETQFGTNHLGHFALITRLVPLIRDGGRVVMLSSAGHRFADVDLDDPGFARTPYDPWVAYGRSKTANILFAVEFDRRHRGRGVRAAAVHPGVIRTQLTRHLDPDELEARIEEINRQRAEQGLPERLWKSVPQGAATSVWTAVVASPETIGGRYAEDCQVSPIIDDATPLTSTASGVRGYALDPDRARALWSFSEQCVGDAIAA